MIVVLTLLAVYEASRFESYGGRSIERGRSRWACSLSFRSCCGGPGPRSPQRQPRCSRITILRTENPALTVVSMCIALFLVGAPRGPPWSPRRRAAVSSPSSSSPPFGYRLLQRAGKHRSVALLPRRARRRRVGAQTQTGGRSARCDRRGDGRERACADGDGGTRAHRPGAPRHRRSSPVRDRRRERGVRD